MRERELGKKKLRRIGNKINQVLSRGVVLDNGDKILTTDSGLTFKQFKKGGLTPLDE